MGRELKRVPLDFSWKLNKVWDGYLNNHHGEQCPFCDGSGSSQYYIKLNSQWYSHLNGGFKPEMRKTIGKWKD